MKHHIINWLQRTIIIFQAITIRTAARQLRESQARVMELEAQLRRERQVRGAEV